MVHHESEKSSTVIGRCQRACHRLQIVMVHHESEKSSTVIGRGQRACCRLQIVMVHHESQKSSNDIGRGYIISEHLLYRPVISQDFRIFLQISLCLKNFWKEEN